MKLTILKFLLAMLLFPFLLEGQSQEDDDWCSTGNLSGTFMNRSDIYKRQIQEKEAEYFSKRLGLIRGTEEFSDIPIKVHVTRESDGSQEPWFAVNDIDVAEMIEKINKRFYDTYFNFYLCGEVNYIDDSELNDFTLDDGQEFLDSHYVPNVINILIVRYGPNCGSATGVGHDVDRITLTKACSKSTTVPTHEMGHYFDLAHTHASEITASENEFVDGSNCSFTGDAICDTPADPGLSLSTVDEECNYTGGEVDAQGDLYTPPVKNFMAYGRRSCKSEFTIQQHARMFAAFKVSRTYLTCDGLAVDFKADFRNHCESPAKVCFSDNSSGALSWEWDVDGDDITDYTTQNPVHYYNDQGIYDTRLTITVDNGGTLDTLTKVYRKYINIANPILISSDYVKLVFRTDFFPSTNTWSFSQGDTILSQYDAYTNDDGLQTFEYIFTVAEGSCYLFTINDEWGNGLIQGPGNGYYALYDDQDNELVKKVYFGIRDEILLNTETTTSNKEAPTLQEEISVFPNLSKDFLHIKSKNKTLYIDSYSIISTMGRVVKKGVLHQSDPYIIDVSTLAPEQYFIKIVSREQVVVLPFIKI